MAGIKKILEIAWIIILIFLWVCFPFFPGDILFWMWLAIIWSAIGGVVGTIFFMSESKKNEKLIGIIWAVILVILWMFYPLFPGNTFVWMLLAIIWSAIGGILALGVFIVRRNK